MIEHDDLVEMKPFHHLLKEFRIHLALSQEKFANRYGIQVRTLRRWERGNVGGPHLPQHSMLILEFIKYLSEKVS